MSVNDRISEFCKVKKISQKELVKKNYGSKQTVSFVLNSKQYPNYRFLNNLVNDFPDLNAQWLLTGKGEMLLKPYHNKKKNTPDHNILEEPTSPDFNKRCTNPECNKKIKELEEKVVKFLFEIKQLHEEKIEWLEQQKGAPPPEKKDGGDVEKPQETGT